MRNESVDVDSDILSQFPLTVKSLRQRVKRPLSPKREQAEDRMFNIVSRYDEFIENDDI